MTQTQIDKISEKALTAIRTEAESRGLAMPDTDEEEIYLEVIKALDYQIRHFQRYSYKKR